MSILMNNASGSANDKRKQNVNKPLNAHPVSCQSLITKNGSNDHRDGQAMNINVVRSATLLDPLPTIFRWFKWQRRSAATLFTCSKPVEGEKFF